MKANHPYFGFFPAFPMPDGGKNIELGDWTVGRPSDCVAWKSARFELFSRKIISAVENQGFKNSALVWNTKSGFDGRLPNEQTRQAIEVAIRFAAMESNVRSFIEHDFHTTENTRLFWQPIDESDGRITYHQSGSLRELSIVGLSIGERPYPLPESTLPIDRPLILSHKIATAAFLKLTRDSKNVETRRLAIALKWHATAMLNSNAIDLGQRIVALKTGFESLLDESSSRKGAKKLRRLLYETTHPYRGSLPWTGLLYSPDERTDIKRSYRNKEDMRSEIEEWFMALSNARNAVIHDGKVPDNMVYQLPERPLSRYGREPRGKRGNIFWVGERVLREAIKAKLGVEILLCGLRPTSLIATQIAGTPETIDNGTFASEKKPKEPCSARTVSELLKALKCKAANEVEVDKCRAHAATTPEQADENARRAKDMWTARAGSISILLNKSEKDKLLKAGAEKKLPNFVWPCD